MVIGKWPVQQAVWPGTGISYYRQTDRDKDRDRNRDRHRESFCIPILTIPACPIASLIKIFFFLNKHFFFNKSNTERTISICVWCFRIHTCIFYFNKSNTERTISICVWCFRIHTYVFYFTFVFGLILKIWFQHRSANERSFEINSYS